MEENIEQNNQGRINILDEAIDNPSIMLDIQGVIQMLKNNKSPGQDKVAAELIKYRDEQLVKLHSFNVHIVWVN